MAEYKKLKFDHFNPTQGGNHSADTLCYNWQV